MVTEIKRESDSATLHPFRGSIWRAALPAPRPGQYLTVALRQPDPTKESLLRNYGLSGPPRAGFYRITVKREPEGAASGYLHRQLAVGDLVDVAAPRGTFILQDSKGPVLLVSAGIGATPVLAMLHALADAGAELTSTGCSPHATAANARSRPK